MHYCCTAPINTANTSTMMYNAIPIPAITAPQIENFFASFEAFKASS